jgi:hypothetical protein
MMKDCKRQLMILTFMFILCTITWGFALWFTGARVDFRLDVDSGLVAIHLAPERGASFQCSGQGCSLWLWTPNSNRRVWSVE